MRPFGLGVNSKFTWVDARKKFELCNARENRGRTTIDICVIGMFDYEDPHRVLFASYVGSSLHACFSSAGNNDSQHAEARRDIFKVKYHIIMFYYYLNIRLLCINDKEKLLSFINRSVAQDIVSKCFQGKALIIYGARQVGKTTLIKSLLPALGVKVLELNGDDSDIRDHFQNPNVTSLKQIMGNAKLLFIDEAQRIPDIGLAIKIMVDRIPDVQVIATGSSSFDLLETIREPLTGRAWQWNLFPISFSELAQHFSLHEEKRNLESRLLYGSYPEIVMHNDDAIDRLKLLTGSYLYRDLYSLPTISRPGLLEKITKALALQIGAEVSSSEIAQLVGADRLTVEKYISMLEKAFVIFQLSAFSRNVRNEIKKGRKIYFFDNGIRNAVINNFASLSSRTDVGALWENYCISERYKTKQYGKHHVTHYFWRTTQQQEIDLIEEDDQAELKAFEFKWNPRKQVLFSKTFLNAYDVAEKEIITPGNYEQFLSSVQMS